MEDVETKWDVRVPMDDGVHLSTDIYLPKQEKEKYPAILIRTPYNKSRKDEIKHGTRDVEFFAKNGYTVVFQDVRGRGDSDGEWEPYYKEGQDGCKTIEWISNQNWCDGRVGMIGGSYRGFLQWISAKENPEPLTTMVSTAAVGDWFRETPFNNGTISLYMIEWLNFVGGRTVQNQDPIDWEKVLWHLPVKSMDEKLGRENTIWKKWIEHNTLDQYWKQYLLTEKDFREIDLPVLHITGWYDGDQPGALYFYEGMKENSPKNNEQYLISGPWSHAQTRIPDKELGGVDFTEKAILELKKIHLLWFDAKLKGDEEAKKQLEEIFRGKKVKYFTMGENEWEDGEYWPPSPKKEEFYLSSSGKANTLLGDGTLKSKSQSGESPDSYIYDPEDPVMAEVDFNFYSESHTRAPLDQRFIERRDDVLVYTSEPLEKSLKIAGTPKINFYASSNREDTDWIALLSDVHPNGKSIKLTEGYLRARFKNSLEEPELLEPNKIYEYDFEMTYALSNLFKPGHRIRICITSSYFPKIARNPNSGEEVGEGKKIKKAEQTIYHDEEHPSKIILPIIRN